MDSTGDTKASNSHHSDISGLGHESLSGQSLHLLASHHFIHHDNSGHVVTCKDAARESLLVNHSVGLPDCKSHSEQKHAYSLPSLKLDLEDSSKFAVDAAKDEGPEEESFKPEVDAKYGLESSYEMDTSKSYLHASINRKQGGVDEVFANEHLTSPGGIKGKAEPDVWTVGAVTAGHEQQIFSDRGASVWVGLGATVNPVFDRELRERTSAAPVTVFTNVQIKY